MYKRILAAVLCAAALLALALVCGCDSGSPEDKYIGRWVSSKELSGGEELDFRELYDTVCHIDILSGGKGAFYYDGEQEQAVGWKLSDNGVRLTVDEMDLDIELVPRQDGTLIWYYPDVAGDGMILEKAGN